MGGSIWRAGRGLQVEGGSCWARYRPLAAQRCIQHEYSGAEHGAVFPPTHQLDLTAHTPHLISTK